MADDLLAQAQTCLDTLDAEGAVALCRRACETNPAHVAALDMLGEASLQAGDPEAARAALLRSVELAPDGAGCRYMSLGQLAEGAEVMRWFDRGLVRARPRPPAQHAAAPTHPPTDAAGETARGAECN